MLMMLTSWLKPCEESGFILQLLAVCCALVSATPYIKVE